MDILGVVKHQTLILTLFSGGVAAVFGPISRAIRGKLIRKPFSSPDLQSKKTEIQGQARSIGETMRLAVGDYYDFIYRDGFNDERRLRIKVKEICKASSFFSRYVGVVKPNDPPFAVVELEFPTTNDCVQIGASALKIDGKFFLEEAPYLSALPYSVCAIETFEDRFSFLQVFVSHIDTSKDQVDLRIFAVVATLASG